MPPIRNAEEFLQYTYILDWMARVERVDLEPVRNKIITAITSSSRESLFNALDHNDWHVRYFSYRALLRKEPDNGIILEKGSRDSNSKIRWSIFQHICSFEENIKTQYISLFLRDPAPRICSAAMMAIPECRFQEKESIVYQNMFSSSPSIRNTARYLLKEYGIDSFADTYRSRLKSGEVTAGVISGLAETGNTADFNLIFVYRSSSTSRIRSAAIAGIYRLDEERAIPYLMEALKDPSGKVRTVSVSLLCKCTRLDDDKVRNLLSVEETGSRISALKVLCRTRSWESLIDIFALITDTDGKIKKMAWDTFVQWYLKRSAKNWVKPPEEVLHKVENKIHELNLKSFDIPDNARACWKNLPVLIESGKKLWTY
jgi:hypothetical protein